MIFYYVRHGDPIYAPDSLTPLGERQAEAVGKRLAVYGIDRIFASTSERAKLTAKPLSELINKEITELDFANECYTWDEFTLDRKDGRYFLFHDKEARSLFADESVYSLGHKWYEHPEFAKHKKFKEGTDRIYDATYDFFKSLGYEHIRHTGRYKIIEPNNERIAFFAHQGFGLAFMSVLLDIPYPFIANHFDRCHSGVTTIEFEEQDEYAIPKVLSWSSDSHIYKEGLPTKYNNLLYI